MLEPEAISSAELFFSRLGVDRTGEPEVPIRIRPYPEVCHRGVVRPSVLVVAVDFIAGVLAAQGAGTDWVFTTDLSLRAPARLSPDEIATTGSLLRSGRTSITSEVQMEVDGAPFAYAQAGFARIARRDGDPEQLDVHATQTFSTTTPLARPFATEVGIEVASPGHAVVELREELRNPAGAMQGSIVSLLAEVAAESLADANARTPQVVTDLDIRYLAMVREGPMEAEASWIAEPGSGAIRVVLRDRGNRGRIATTVLVRTADAPTA